MAKLQVNSRKVNATAEFDNAVINADILTSGNVYAGIENGNVFDRDGNQMASFYQAGADLSLYFYNCGDRPAVYAIVEEFIADAMASFAE